MPGPTHEKDTPPRSDGRTARSQRSKTAIAMAMMELIASGQSPTAKQIAEHAGVSLRLVFHHFQDMASIYNMMLALQFERLKPLLAIDIPTDAPFDKRLGDFADHRTTLLEFISPTRKAVMASGLTSEAVADGVNLCRHIKEEQVGRVFALELSQYGKDEAAHRLAALKAATSWFTWHTLRDHQGLSMETAGLVMTHMIRSILLFTPHIS